MPFSPDGQFMIGKIDCLPENVYINCGIAAEGLTNSFSAGKILV